MISPEVCYLFGIVPSYVGLAWSIATGILGAYLCRTDPVLHKPLAIALSTDAFGRASTSNNQTQDASMDAESIIRSVQIEFLLVILLLQLAVAGLTSNLNAFLSPEL